MPNRSGLHHVALPQARSFVCCFSNLHNFRSVRTSVKKHSIACTFLEIWQLLELTNSGKHNFAFPLCRDGTHSSMISSITVIPLHNNWVTYFVLWLNISDDLSFHITCMSMQNSRA
ncbi:unnamed protein product [Protopolystoma xenopodis]|uniref:Uncharacterized protein n=1 Tax=Protopolystoma xenopodis TaxID=117903 RepID=A0A448WFS1_9PLAT|nr:unnamed protein product [Protopolystoma xenopodis]